MEVSYSPQKIRTYSSSLPRALQSLRNIIIAILEDMIGFTQHVNPALRVYRLLKHSGLEIAPSEFSNTIKNRELSWSIQNGGYKSYFSEWTKLRIWLARNKFQNTCNRKAKGDYTDHIWRARRKIIPCCLAQKSLEEGPVKFFSENFENSCMVFGKNPMKCKDKPRIVLYGTYLMVGTAKKHYTGT